MARDAHRAAWEDWATLDPLWAALTHPEYQHGGWGQDLDRFFALGRESVDAMLARAAAFGTPREHRRALDFGCGAGRLTVALAGRFDDVVGLDVAAGMVEEARRLDAERSGVRFAVHDTEDLAGLKSGTVDFVCSLMVLQHVPTRDVIERLLREFVRILSVGGVAVVHLPVYVPARYEPRRRLAPRRRAMHLLRAAGVSPRFLYRRLGWRPPMTMTGIPRDETISVFESAGGTVLDVDPPSRDDYGVESCLYYVTPAPLE